MSALGNGIWAIVEQMGHARAGGFVTEVELAGARLLRVDLPEQVQWGRRYPAATVFVSGGNLYRLTPCTEEQARKVTRSGIAVDVYEEIAEPPRLAITQRDIAVEPLPPTAHMCSVDSDLPAEDCGEPNNRCSCDEDGDEEDDAPPCPRCAFEANGDSEHDLVPAELTHAEDCPERPAQPVPVPRPDESRLAYLRSLPAYKAGDRAGCDATNPYTEGTDDHAAWAQGRADDIPF
ncbi:MAG TPA: hypothetical protein VEB22_15235 [Phycisphaerales bacterium]|nr:hypothetical protein [Phycisphaerales bacterium]